MRKQIQNRFLYFIICCSLIFIMPMLPVFASEKEEKTILKVAFPETEGISEIYDNGTYGGSTYDFLMEIAKYTGWEYEFITGNSDDLLHGMMKSEYDLMGGMFYQPEWEKYFNYPKYVAGKNYSFLICLNDNQAAKSFDLSTLNNMKIGVYSRAFSKIEKLENFLAFNKLNCEIQYYEDLSEYEKCLDRKEADLMLGNLSNIKEGYRVVAQFESDPYYIVTAKTKPELNMKLSEALTEIYSANPNFLDELYEKYFPDEVVVPIDFNETDKEFIKTVKTIRVAVIQDRYPLYYEKEGRECGVVPDLFDLIQNKTGLSFEFIPVQAYWQAIDLVKQGQAEIIGCYMEDAYAAKEKGLSLVKSYATLDTVILKNKAVTFPSDGLVMAVQRGHMIQNTIKNGTIQYYDTYEACLEAIHSGKADFMRIPSVFLETLYLQDFYSNIMTVAAENIEAEVSIALPNPINIKLYSILSKSINNLSKDEMNDLLSKNLISMGERAISLKSFIYTNPGTIFAVSAGFFILLSIIVLLSARYKLKNKVMQIRMEKAVETAQAKSEFLSRMSHEIRTPMNAIIGLTSLTQISCQLPVKASENLEKINTSAQFLLSLVNDILDMSKIDNKKMKIEEMPFDLDLIIEQVKDIFTFQAKQNGLVFTIEKEFDDGNLIGDEIRMKQVLTNLLSNACKFTNAGGSVTLYIKQKEEKEQKREILFGVKDTGVGIKQEDIGRVFDSFEQVSHNKSNIKGTGLGLSISHHLVHLMGGELQVKSRIGKGSEFYFSLWLPVCDQKKTVQKADKEDSSKLLNGIRILLAEDNDLNAEIVISILELKGVILEWAVNGQEAVNLFMKHPAGWFDFILMDIQMPVKDGLTACMEIRENDRSDAKTIPIIAMTANTFEEDREKAAKVGMTGFIPKPFHIEQLYEILSQMI